MHWKYARPTKILKFVCMNRTYELLEFISIWVYCVCNIVGEFVFVNCLQALFLGISLCLLTNSFKTFQFCLTGSGNCSAGAYAIMSQCAICVALFLLSLSFSFLLDKPWMVSFVRLHVLLHGPAVAGACILFTVIFRMLWEQLGVHI